MISLQGGGDKIFQVWRRNYLQFKRAWFVAFFWILFEPLVILGSIGYGVGAYIHNMVGVSYIDFFFPGLLCSSSMIISFFEATYGNFSKLKYQATYSTMILSPLGPREVVLGEVLWAASKGTFSSLGILLVGLPLGLVDNLFVVPAIFVIFISSILFASLGMFVTSLAKNYDSIIFPTSGLIVPMALLCGTYYPIDQMPFFLKGLVYLLPLTHTVSAVRGLFLKGFEWSQLLNLVFLLSMSAVFLRLAIKKIEKKLIC